LRRGGKKGWEGVRERGGERREGRSNDGMMVASCYLTYRCCKEAYA